MADVELDAIDRQLLRLLDADARASGRALARQLRVAESTVALRIRRLVASGVIEKFGITVDKDRIGLPLEAMVSCQIGHLDRTAIAALRRDAPTWPGVLSVFHMAGSDDFIIHVVATDADALRDFVVDNLASHPAITRTQTNLVFENLPGTGWASALDAD